MESNLSECPNGHLGLVVDGTFEAIGGALQIKRAGPVTQLLLSRIEALGEDVKRGKITPSSALDDILELLPEELAAPIKKVGAKHPALAIYIVCLVIIGLTAAAATQVASAFNEIARAYSFISPASPSPLPSISNNITVINKITTDDPRPPVKSKGIKSPDDPGRLEHDKKKKEKARKKRREQRPKRKRNKKPNT
jgi:hypothetical protein